MLFLDIQWYAMPLWLLGLMMVAALGTISCVIGWLTTWKRGLGFFVTVQVLGIALHLSSHAYAFPWIPPDCQGCCEMLGYWACFFLGCGGAMC